MADEDTPFDDSYFALVDAGGDPDQRGPLPADEPLPDDIVNVWEWRESQRLRSVHTTTTDAHPRCEHCRQDWPCTGIQMASLAEVRARGDALPPTWLTWTHNADDVPDERPGEPRAVGIARIRHPVEPET